MVASDSSSLIFLTLFGLLGLFSDSLFCGSVCGPDREDGAGGGGGGGGVCSKGLVGALPRDRAGDEAAEGGNPSMPAPGGVKAAKDSRETPRSVHGATRAAPPADRCDRAPGASPAPAPPRLQHGSYAFQPPPEREGTSPAQVSGSLLRKRKPLTLRRADGEEKRIAAERTVVTSHRYTWRSLLCNSFQAIFALPLGRLAHSSSLSIS